jgi:hypothetical protein
MAFPTVSLLTLELSEPEEQGTNSASLQVADGITSTLAIALGGSIYHALSTTGPASGSVYVLLYALYIAIAGVAWLLAPRVRKPVA